MQRTEITLVCDNGVLRSIGTGTLSRGVVNELAISFLNRSGKPIDITAVARWEAVVTEDYLRKTPALLASDDSEVIGGDGGGDGEGNGIPPNAVLVRLPGDSAELAAVIDGRKSMQCFVTLYGRNAADDIVNVYVFPLVALNIGVAYDDVSEQAALSGLFYTRAQIDAIKAQIYRDMAALGGGEGLPGAPGENGVTPHIDPVTKHWMIGAVDTGVVAEGKDGAPGTPGENGVTPHIDPVTKHWMIEAVDTGVVAEGKDGAPGTPGAPGSAPEGVLTEDDIGVSVAPLDSSGKVPSENLPARELPEVTDEDEGKVLTVDGSGNWVADEIEAVGVSLANSIPLADQGSGSAGSSLQAARADHVHPASDGPTPPPDPEPERVPGEDGVYVHYYNAEFRTGVYRFLGGEGFDRRWAYAYSGDPNSGVHFVIEYSVANTRWELNRYYSDNPSDPSNWIFSEHIAYTETTAMPDPWTDKQAWARGLTDRIHDIREHVPLPASLIVVGGASGVAGEYTFNDNLAYPRWERLDSNVGKKYQFYRDHDDGYCYLSYEEGWYNPDYGWECISSEYMLRGTGSYPWLCTWETSWQGEWGPEGVGGAAPTITPVYPEPSSAAPTITPVYPEPSSAHIAISESNMAGINGQYTDTGQTGIDGKPIYSNGTKYLLWYDNNGDKVWAIVDSPENNYWDGPPELSSDIYFYKSNLNTGYMEHGQEYGPDVLLTNNL